MAVDYLAGLLTRREELVAAATVDIKVPLWDRPKVWLRVHPVEHKLIRKQQDRVQRATRGAQAGVELEAMAVIVAAAVDEVIIGEGDGQARVKLYDMKETLGFDADAEVEQSALVRALCIREADIVSMAKAVSEHSGYEDTEVDKALAGE